MRSPLSMQEGNYLRHGEDGGIFADGKLSVTVVSANEGNLIKTGSDKGALLTKDDITDAVEEIVSGVVTAGTMCSELRAETADNQIVCAAGKIYVTSDYGTMGE